MCILKQGVFMSFFKKSIIFEIDVRQVECNKGPDSDKAAFSAWIQELHTAFQPLGLLLSAAVSPSYKVIDAGQAQVHQNFY